MNQRERAQVVELLRCAADLLVSGRSMFPILDVAKWLDVSCHHATFQRASDARLLLDGKMPRDQHQILEAAARVEEGTWP